MTHNELTITCWLSTFTVSALAWAALTSELGRLVLALAVKVSLGQ